MFNLRKRSLVRGNVLVIGSLLAALELSGFPASRKTPWLAVPAVVAAWGMVETVRCMRRRWDWYHGGVVLCVYMDLMALSLMLFFLFSPYLL